ncbi:ATP-binding protein [uncultured Brevundimonas sp.]|uniref:ATP-binding protein n=1 Tax=uncultured Brevundimonas sp. TaxID=213418 RepID=UPI0025EAE18E|nr:ATP-binding protein [uncultured Brevundimonas sp.]
MASVDRKTEIAPIDGTPEKRMFWSIISDYGLLTGLCELVDNAIDLWNTNKRKRALRVLIDLNSDQQVIVVSDNAGGVARENLRLLVAPGGSSNDPDAEVIGIFGVGSKRAEVALGETIQITTRHGSGDSFQVDVTKAWLESDIWELPAYQVPNITPHTTRIEISKLRKPVRETNLDVVREHLGEVYSRFLGDDCVIEVNGSPIEPRKFDVWAYPDGFEPVAIETDCNLGDGHTLKARITAGLIRDRDPEADNYGVYFYLNGRLVAKELKVREVGYFVSAEAGVPHPDASLCRAIVEINGAARLMPWNSSKSQIDFGHEGYLCLRPNLIQLVSRFSKLSRHLKHDWEGRVFNHDEGEVHEIEADEITARGRIVLPPLPKTRKPQIEKLKSRNKAAIRQQPWTLGLVEAFGAVDVIIKQKLETRNRIALILLDSNFEIALKEYIVHDERNFPPRVYTTAKLEELFSKRHLVLSAIKSKVDIPPDLLAKSRHYYALRNKLVHERATADITPSDIDNYRDAICRILKILFGLRCD